MLRASDLRGFCSVQTSRPGLAAADFLQRTILRPVPDPLRARGAGHRNEDLHDVLGLHHEPPLRTRRDAATAGTSGRVLALPSGGASL